ncbi:MAG: hypothetical protein H6733_06355 [Alphaproteobacteria bacterium]|nr:hypothetical protein [Alphaproteobacteria bacterium]
MSTRPALTAPLLLLLLTACGGRPSPAPEPVSPAPSASAAVDIDDPQACAACHPAIVGEWTQSMHAHAHQDADPVYAAMRTLRLDKQGAELATACNACHTPRNVADDTAPEAKVGVSCATCHTTVAVTPGKKGAAALVAATDGALHGPHDLPAGASPAHGTGAASPVLTDGTAMCMACHDATKTPTGADACTTGPEHVAAGAGTCTSCHMPRVDGAGGPGARSPDHASHAFVGPHRAWYQDDPSLLVSAVAAKGTLDASGLSLSLENTAGHAVPTGFPGRVAMVRIVGLDAEGDQVWVAPDDPQLVWRKVYVDADGKPVMPPFSERLLTDTRLAPGQTLTRTWSPPAEVTTVQVELVLRLVPPPAVETLHLAGTVEAQPRTAVLATVTRTP